MSDKTGRYCINVVPMWSVDGNYRGLTTYAFFGYSPPMCEHIVPALDEESAKPIAIEQHKSECVFTYLQNLKEQIRLFESTNTTNYLHQYDED